MSRRRRRLSQSSSRSPRGREAGRARKGQGCARRSWRGGSEPDERYLEAVRRRFGQWILDTASARYEQAWLDYQHEIGLRHHRAKKNRTDGVDAEEHIPFRYLMALVYPITATLKPFLAKRGDPPEDVEKMHQAWVKAVLLQVILWSHPYVRPGDF